MKQRQVNGNVRIGMDDSYIGIAHLQGYGQFLHAFTGERFLFRFIWLNFSADEFPQHVPCFARWPLTDHEPVFVPD